VLHLVLTVIQVNPDASPEEVNMIVEGSGQQIFAQAVRVRHWLVELFIHSATLADKLNAIC